MKARYESLYIVWFHLCKGSIIGKSTATESRLVIAWGWERGEAGERGVTVGGGRGSLLGSGWSSKLRLWWLLPNSMTILKIIEVYALNGWILRYVNYISVKILKIITQWIAHFLVMLLIIHSLIQEAVMIWISSIVPCWIRVFWKQKRIYFQIPFDPAILHEFILPSVLGHVHKDILTGISTVTLFVVAKHKKI